MAIEPGYEAAFPIDGPTPEQIAEVAAAFERGDGRAELAWRQALNEASILRGQLDDANAKIASLGAINAEVEGSNDTLRAALLEACEQWENQYRSDYNDAPPPEIARLRALVETPTPPAGTIRVVYMVPVGAAHKLTVTWSEP